MPKASLLLGPHEWTVHNDSEKCTNDQSYTINMVMTACNDTEFTCSDGSCVSMERRCDGKVERTEQGDGDDDGDALMVMMMMITMVMIALMMVMMMVIIYT